MFDYDVIREVYNDLMKERRRYKKDLTEKAEKIRNIDNYLNSLFSKDENDSQVFLARKVESLYRDEIQRNRQERERLAMESEHLEEYIQGLNRKIDKLKKILSNKSNSSMLHVKHLSNASCIDILTDVVQRIDSVFLSVDKDSEQAKIELGSINKDISKVIDDLKKIEKSYNGV